MPLADSLKTGDRFHRLTVLEIFRKERGRHGAARFVRVQCDCGRVTHALPYALLSGLTKSCGCLQREVVRGRNRTHGLSKTPSYGIWLGMRDRCANPKHSDYDLYGARGVRVCKRWDSYELFLADMGERPDGKSIDRIDTNGNYEPGNCRWATPKQQARNVRKNRWLQVGDKVMLISEAQKSLHHSWRKIVKMIASGEIKEVPKSP